MKLHTIPDFHNGKLPPPNSLKKFLLLLLYFILLTTIPFCLRNTSPFSLLSPPESDDISSLEEDDSSKTCNVFNGTWVPYFEEPYYTNETCNLIIDQQNCLKFGRPNKEFLNWRWKPDECELPLFDAVQFLELVRGKSLAFLGDSVGKNQMHSLLCLLTKVAYPEDLSDRYYTDTSYFKRYFYPDYNFTMGTLWAPFLVKSIESDSNGYSPNSQMNLYLDEPNEGWLNDVEKFDYVIVSAGQWFFRPTMLHENGSLIGCSTCKYDNLTTFTPYYAYRKAFRTVFRTLLGLENYKGVTFLRTFSPSHFENGAWNEGGNCVRTRPFAREELKVDQYIWDMHSPQVEEFRVFEELGKKRGLEFKLMDTTEAMLMRPDGHPNFYGHSPHRNMTLADCVHWCLPGPIDVWNEFLLYFLRTQQSSLDGKTIEV
ncbi:hypothetical protein CsatB_020951 [Cannabis sativa]|uniref:Trichome birefringence-like N-terminal domain-containing protein n=1 Tax=Cannabis sativa TaxID=3483 RepID=A0A7J6E1P2_CANSA|nr:protein trichome birefringence-like 19 [Cannabis sativa]KAF4352314.1 hypothetical protein G4B88_000917 [Cannabis sativa]